MIWAGAFALGVTCPALAGDSFPVRSLRFIIPFAPGGSIDVIARIIGHKVNDAWGQQVVIDNRPGAGGNLSAQLAANAAPDGYTLYLCTPSFGVNPSLYRRVAYDPFKDFSPVSLLAATQNVLLAHPAFPAKSVRTLIAMAREKPGTINYASTGGGSSGHLTMELFKNMAHVDLVHVPYKMIGQALNDVIAGQVMIWFPSLPGALPHIRSGKIVALATGGAQRSTALPEVPTVAESGVTGYESSTWYAALVPAGTANKIVAKLHSELTSIVKATDTQERLTAQGVDVIASTPTQLAYHLKMESQKWAEVIRVSGARAD